MEELNKTQLILLALLVSFVTSIATGIVTVALMDQAPPAITQTINRIIKETERVIVPAKQQATVETVIVKEEDYIVKAVATNSANVVSVNALARRKSRLGFTVASDTRRVVSPLGMGLVLTKSGTVAFPSAFLDTGEEFALGTNDGSFFLFKVKTRDAVSGLAIAEMERELLPAEPDPENDVPGVIVLDPAKAPPKDSATKTSVSFIDVQFVSAGSMKLGQTAVALGLFGTGERILLGTLSGFSKPTEKTTALLSITINGGAAWSGSPLFDSTGKVLGITTSTASGESSAVLGEVAKTLLAGVIEVKETENASSNAPK